MEKRVLIAVVLSFLVLYAYQAYFVRPAPRTARGSSSPAAGAPAQAGTEAPGPATVGTPAQASAATAETPAAVAIQASVSEPTEREISVETESVRAVFTNRGARLKSWKLKHYVDLGKQPQELVPVEMPAGTASPFDLRVGDAAVTARMRDALFRVSETGSVLDGTGAARTLVFEYRDSSGLEVRKEFGFEPRSFVVRFSAGVTMAGQAENPWVLWGPGLGDVVGGKSSSYVQKPEGILFRGDKVQRLSSKDLTAQPAHDDNTFSAAGVDDQYFISMALPTKGLRIEYEPVNVAAFAGQDAKMTREYVSYAVKQRGAADGLRFYFGPKDFDVLGQVDRRLVRAINFGIFDWLAVPLLRALKWVYGYVGNYGWAIIILTLLINGVMFPLRHKSVVSMRKMQELQPEIKAIQDRYKSLKMGDPERQKMNTETMALYRERGVNPASGCLPMLLTFPVLFAFYSLLSQAIEIRGAPFALWIKDLSMHDPLYVTPILMGISMVWQQKMTPTSADPVQQKMMMAMPLVFTFMFLWAPSGLVIYWLLSNLLAIGQQYVTNQIVGPVKTPRPPAERRVRKAGSQA